MRLRFTPVIALILVLGSSLARASVPPGTPATDFSETKYAVVTETFADRTQVKAGDKFTLALRLTPYKTAEYEFHLYGTEPSPNQDYLKPVFKMADSPGVKWTVEFPQGEKHDGGKKPDGSYKGDIYVLHGQQ